MNDPIDKTKFEFQTMFFVFSHKNAPRKCLTFWGHCSYMPFFTELLLSFVLLPAAISLSFLSILVQAGQVSSPFEILHMAATLIPVSVLIGWEYGKFKK